MFPGNQEIPLKPERLKKSKMETRPHSTNMKGCKVCFSPYDFSERRPRSLPCGHTFCSHCISAYLKEKKIVCPSCRREYEASASKDFPVNFELESFMQEDHISDQQNAETVCSLSDDKSRDISKMLRSVRLEFRSDMEDLSTCSHETYSQLYQYKSQLMEWKKQHQENLEEHRVIVYQSEDMINLIDKENLRVDETIENGKEKGKKMKTTSSNLTAASTSHEVTTALDEAEICYNNLGKWTKEVKKHFPDSKLVIQSEQLKQRSKSGLLKYSSCLDNEGAVATAQEVAVNQCHNINVTSSKEEVYHDDPTEYEDLSPSSTIEERTQNALDDMPVQHRTQSVQTHITAALQVKDLVNMTPVTRQLLESNQVFAVKEDKEKIRYARFTLEQNQSLCLHVLGNPQCLPQDAFLLQHDDVMKLVDPSSRLTFLELGVDGRSLGRLMIRLSPDTKSTQQFSILCTGEMGPSYTDTNIMHVYNKGDDEKEYVVFGDYEWNGRSGGKAILPGVDWKKERNNEVHVRPYVVGSVVNGNYTEEHAALFAIFTRDRNKINGIGIFGIVEDGMSILTEAVSNYPDIKKCFIRDSGIVLNL